MPIRIQIDAQPNGGGVAYPKDLLIAAIEEATQLPLPPTTKFNLQVIIQSPVVEVAPEALPPCEGVTNDGQAVSIRWRAVELLNGGARMPVRVREGQPRPLNVRVRAEAVVVDVEPEPGPLAAVRDLALD